MQFIEDTAVPPDNLPAYVRGVRSIFREHGIVGVIFGHAGDAHVHVNPLIDVQQPGWRDKVLRILDQVVTLTASLGGTLAGEHGDGRLRTPLMSRVWPPEAITAFRMVKEAFDPLEIFNPGVKVPLPDQQPLSDIKYDPALPPLPHAAAAALTTVARDRAYNAFRLDLIGQAS
jgi:FAD/FMN-containing dehydrogenase